jgi:DNA-binding MarR family transcriptional regulator
MKPQAIKKVRAFNRFYTNIIGLLDKHILDSKYSLPEVRILFELYHHAGLSASEITALLAIDKGYLSRILKRFEKDKLIHKTTVSADKRSALLELTTKGKKEFELLNIASDKQIAKAFENLTEDECDQLVQKMDDIQQLINKSK